MYSVAVITKSVKGPLCGFADEQLRIGKRTPQGRDGRGVAAVAEGEGGVAEQAAPLGPGQRRAAEPSAKLLLGQAQQFDQVDRVEVGPRPEGALGGGGGLAVPRADFLA